MFRSEKWKQGGTDGGDLGAVCRNIIVNYLLMNLIVRLQNLFHKLSAQLHRLTGKMRDDGLLLHGN